MTDESPVRVATKMVPAVEGQCRSAWAHRDCTFAGETIQKDDYTVPMCALSPNYDCPYWAGKFSGDIPVYG